jgi:hypothetical protein
MAFVFRLVPETRILERSGIGRPAVLSRVGVDARVESHNVGERIIEQHGAAVHVRFTGLRGSTGSNGWPAPLAALATGQLRRPQREEETLRDVQQRVQAPTAALDEEHRRAPGLY